MAHIHRIVEENPMGLRGQQWFINGASARILLWLALFSPTLITLNFSASIHNWRSLVWAAAASAIPAALPRRLFVVMQWTTLAALPFLWWWLGYAAMDGVGPGWDADMAALSTNAEEVWAAFRLASSMPGFLGFAFFCTLCTLGSIALQIRAHPAFWHLDIPKQLLQGILGVSLMLFAVSATSEATRVMTWAPFQPSDASFSPLGAVVNIVLAEGDNLLYGPPSVAATRRIAHAPHHAKGPLLAIFVVGESMRAGGIGPQKINRGRWTLALDRRVRAGLGAWLPTTCASADGTAGSFPMLMTATPPEHYEEARTAPSVIAILKAAGFATAWIDNQDASVFQEKGHDLYWTVSYIASSGGGFDEEMIPVASAFASPLTVSASGQMKPRAMMLHMHGSHFEYVDRYPSNLFPPDPANLTRDELTDLHYEHSEEYSAKVLGELANLLDQVKVPAFLVYTSDHGENLPRDHNGLRAHLGPRASLEDGTVPALVLWNQEMRQTGRPEEVLTLMEKKPMIAHVDVARAFLALAGMMDGPVVPVKDPEILAPVKIDGRRSVLNSCSLLTP